MIGARVLLIGLAVAAYLGPRARADGVHGVAPISTQRALSAVPNAHAIDRRIGSPGLNDG
jgi:hypothetical protein